MGIPNINGSTVAREQSVTDMIESTAREQAALSHILNTQGENLQALMNMPGMTPATLSRANQSVWGLVDSVTKLETHLENLLSQFSSILQPITLTFFKQEAGTVKRLGGAEFVLSHNNVPMCTATSDSAGRVRFACLESGFSYTMMETQAPEGYMLDDTPHAVQVIGRGNILVDGLPADQFVWENTPYLDFTLTKLDDFGDPVPGAIFELRGGAAPRRRTTGADGLALFERVVPGTYTLSEFSTPPGFLPYDATHDIVVTDDGNMTVDDDPVNVLTINDNYATLPVGNFVFDDGGDQYGQRPSTFSVNLYQNSASLGTVGVRSADSGAIPFAPQPMYDDSGTPYIYTFDAVPVPNYSAQVVGDTLTFTLESFDWVGKVAWMDASDPSGRPTQVLIHLLQNGTDVGQVTCLAADDWTFTFAGIALRDPATGALYDYGLAQDPVSGYTTEYSGRNVINTLSAAG